jgi:uncharacterized membrane protein HdeD (DUF308 family)
MTSNRADNTGSAVLVSVTPWWIVLVEGIFALVFGIFLIAETSITTVFLVTVLGVYFLIRGIFSIIQIFVGGSSVHWGWLLFGGIVGIIAGMLVLRHPLYAAFIFGSVLVTIVAIAALVMGIVGLVEAFSGAGWGTGILAALSIIVSILLFANLFVVTLALPYVLAVFMIVGGIVAIVFSLNLRTA